MVLMITSLLVKWYFCMTSCSSECLFMFMMAVVMALSYRLLLKVEWGRTMPMESLVLPSRSTFPSCCCREYLEWREFWPIWMALGKLLKALWLLPPWPSVTASTAPHTSSTWLLILAGLAAGSSRAWCALPASRLRALRSFALPGSKLRKVRPQRASHTSEKEGARVLPATDKQEGARRIKSAVKRSQGASRGAATSLAALRGPWQRGLARAVPLGVDETRASPGLLQ